MKVKMVSFRCDFAEFEALNELSGGHPSWFMRYVICLCCHCLDKAEFNSWMRFTWPQLKKKKLVLVDRE